MLFQHLFWFYSHPAVYIMILPPMGAISEVIACFSRKNVFGYSFVAFSSLAIAVFGFLVWAHHLFVAGISPYSAMVFSFLTYAVAIPSAVKTFNWTATLYKGAIWWKAPMMWVFGFLGLFLVGGLTGLFLAVARPRRPHPRHLLRRRALPLHHGRRRDHGLLRRPALLVAEDDRPDVLGQPRPSSSALLVFVGFNLTFFPQFILGYLGMPRRYHVYPDEFQVLNVLSSAGASILAVGYLLPLLLLHLLAVQDGERAGDNPWRATGLEWKTAVAAAPGELRRDADRERGRLRVFEAGDQSCLTEHAPRTPSDHTGTTATRTIRRCSTTSRRWSSSTKRPRSGMWIFLVTEVMFFGGLFMAYLLYRVWYPEAWSEGSLELDIVLGGFNTVVLIGSSLTMAMAVRAAQTGAPRRR